MVNPIYCNGISPVQDAPYQDVARIEHHYSAERIAKQKEGKVAKQEERARWAREVRFIDSICM